MQLVRRVKPLNTLLNRYCQSVEAEEVLRGDLISNVSNRGRGLKRSGNTLSDRAVRHLNQNLLCVSEAMNGPFDMLSI